MRRALTLARRGEGLVEPNPMVGCVLVKGGRVIAEGYHRRFGGPHAEVEALRRAGRWARGATAYVTLEPCAHFGKTPPCADALIAAGVSRVIAALRDPFPAVAGKGLRKLRRAKIDVVTGLLAEEATELLAPFLTRVFLGRPYVIAKWAQSADGKTATRSRDSQWITGSQARARAHHLRARVDAIAVGIGTLLADDPLLTARNVRIRRRATRVVFDSNLRTPLGAAVVRTATAIPTLILTTRCTTAARQNRRRRLEKAGVRVIECRTRGHRVDLPRALELIAGEGCSNLLVEGGGELVGSLADQRLLDEVHVHTAPLIIGGADARTACAGIGARSMANAWRGHIVKTERRGPDVITIMRFAMLPRT